MLNRSINHQIQDKISQRPKKVQANSNQKAPTDTRYEDIVTKMNPEGAKVVKMVQAFSAETSKNFEGLMPSKQWKGLADKEMTRDQVSQF